MIDIPPLIPTNDHDALSLMKDMILKVNWKPENRWPSAGSGFRSATSGWYHRCIRDRSRSCIHTGSRKWRNQSATISGWENRWW